MILHALVLDEVYHTGTEGTPVFHPAPALTMGAKKVAPSGDCFEAAPTFITDASVIEHPDDYRLVHGNVAKLRGAAHIGNRRLGNLTDPRSRGWPLGSECFKDEIEAALQRAARPPRMGRPSRRMGASEM